MDRFIFFILLFCSFGCFNSKDNLDCEWQCSQIVGHQKLTELNDKMGSLYLSIRCSSQGNDKELILTNSNTEINLTKVSNHNISGVLVYEASMKQIEQLIGQNVSDSLIYKNRLTQILERSTLTQGEMTIPKSKDYSVKNGYRVRRIK